MSGRFTAKLELLGFTLPEWAIPPTEALVREYESQFELTLPSDYREFLVRHGGVSGNAKCAFQEPTPCGVATLINCFYGFTRSDRHDDVSQATELIEGAPDVVAIGYNLMGAMFWLKCTGSDAGHVYLHDHEGRSAWSDRVFSERFPNLHPSIQEYLKLRRSKKLPKKPAGYEHVYRLARSFGEFVESLEVSAE